MKLNFDTYIKAKKLVGVITCHLRMTYPSLVLVALHGLRPMGLGMLSIHTLVIQSVLY